MTSPYVEEASRRAARITKAEQAARREAEAKARWDELCATSGGEQNHLMGLIDDAIAEPSESRSCARSSIEFTTPSGKRWRVTLGEVVP